MMNLLLRLSVGYIAYAPIVRDRFADFGFPVDGVRVAQNSIVNPCPVRPEDKTGNERGILFLGRLRPRSGLQILIDATGRLRKQEQLNLELHVIGSGQEEAKLHSENIDKVWIHWYGEIYDAGQIRDISQRCFAGCYPGNAGLSVIHMMSLSLPVVVHDAVALHQGPEPAFVVDGRHGFLYDHSRPSEGIHESLRKLALDQTLRRQMSFACAEDYAHLTNPSLAIRLWSILRDCRSAAAAELALRATP
jgi:glycosyltransferase involved in cell wall biosynthesis